MGPTRRTSWLCRDRPPDDRLTLPQLAVTPSPELERAGVGAWRRLTLRLPPLPAEPPPGPVAFSPLLVAYVGLVAAIAATAATLTVRPPADPALLVIGGCTVLLLAATAVRTLSGVSSHWSASVFAHLGLTLAAGPTGALVAVAGELAGTELRLHPGWFRGAFNAADQLLSNLAAWEAFHAISGGSFAAGTLGGLAAGATSWLVNLGLLAGVQWLTQPGLRVVRYVEQNAAAILPYHLGAGLTAFGGTILVAREGAGGFFLLLVPVLLLQMFLLVLAARTQSAELLRAAHARERELLLRQALEASDAERRRIARNLHDGVVQDLAVLTGGLRSQAESGGSREAMLNAAQATSEAIDELRDLLQEIAPPDLQEIGLTAALAELAEPLRDEGIEVSIGVDHRAEGVRGTALSATYRIAQEALRNVAQHAHARHVRMAVWREADGNLDLEISDDGVGFTAERRQQQSEAGHLGLSLIHDLARESGGELQVRSAPQQGTTLHARLPVRGAGPLG